MNNKRFYIILFIPLLVVIFSCGSGKSATYRLKSGSPKEITNVSYFSPIYSFEDHDSATSKRGQYLINFTNHAADSIFQVDCEKYRTSNKIFPEDGEVSLQIIKELNSIFEQVIKRGSIENIEIPPIMDSVANEDAERYAMAVLIIPEMNWKHSSFKSITYHLLILDLVSENISFFGSSSNSSGKGYVDRFINNMEEIYGLME